MPPVGNPEGGGPLIHWGFVPWGTGNPAATPLFSLPDDVTLVDPSWKTCSAVSYGAWDPPIKLTKETAMVPATPTLSQQLIATPRIPISAPYGPATAIPSVEDPKTDAPPLLPSIPPENPDRNTPTGDSSSSNVDPTDNTGPSENSSNDDSAPYAPSVKLPSTQTHQAAQKIKDSASSSLATPVVNIQSPAPGPTPGPRLSVQPDIEDTRFALSLVAPVVMPQSDTLGDQILAADPKSISVPASGAPQEGGTTIPPSAVPSQTFTIGWQVFTIKSNALFVEGQKITPGERDKTIGGTQVSLGSSGLLNIGTSAILLGEDEVPPTAVTIGTKVLMSNPAVSSIDGKLVTSLLGEDEVPQTAVTIGTKVLMSNPAVSSIDRKLVTSGGYGVTIDGTVAGLMSSGLMDVGSSMITPSAEQALPTAFTVGSEVLTPNPTAISIDGTTITAGGPGVTVAGTSVNLQASGSLVIGNSTFAVIPTNLTTSPTNLIFEGQATDRGRNMFFRGVVTVTICIILAAL